MKRAAIVSFAVLALGCEPSAQVTRWEIDFGEISPAEVAYMELTVSSTDPITFPYSEEIYRGENPARTIPRLPAGEYLFGAVAFGDDCFELAFAYDVVVLPLSGDMPVAQSLNRDRGELRCREGEVCDGAGVCDTDTADGGM